MKIEHRTTRYYISTKNKLEAARINYLRSLVKGKLLGDTNCSQRFVLTAALQILQVVSIGGIRSMLFFFYFFLKLRKYLTPFNVAGVTLVNPMHVLFRL